MTYAVPRGRRLAFALVPFLVLIAACTPGSAAGPVAAPVGGAYDEAGNPSRAGAGGAQPPAAQQPGTDQSNGSTGQYDVSRPDLLITAGAAVGLGAGCAGQRADRPVAVLGFLDGVAARRQRAAAQPGSGTSASPPARHVRLSGRRSRGSRGRSCDPGSPP